MRIKVTFAQLETRGRLRKLARGRGAPEPTDAERKATRESRRRVLEQLANIQWGKATK